MGRWKVTSLAAAGAVVVAMVIGANPAQAAGIPAATAQVKVTKKVPGVVLSVKKTRRDGFTSWAVTVQRRDGSIVVGYVDQGSGIVFDWTVQRGRGGPIVDLDGPDGTLAPAKPPVTVPGSGTSGSATKPEIQDEPAPASTEDPSSSSPPSGGGPVASAPAASNPSIVYVDENTSWDYSGWDDSSWDVFWSWVWSFWPIDSSWGSPSGDSESTWSNDGGTGGWVPQDPPPWYQGIGVDDVPAEPDWSDDGSDWDGAWDDGPEGPSEGSSEGSSAGSSEGTADASTGGDAPGGSDDD